MTTYESIRTGNKLSSRLSAFNALLATSSLIQQMEESRNSEDSSRKPQCTEKAEELEYDDDDKSSEQSTFDRGIYYTLFSHGNLAASSITFICSDIRKMQELKLFDKEYKEDLKKLKDIKKSFVEFRNKVTRILNSEVFKQQPKTIDKYSIEKEYLSLHESKKAIEPLILKYLAKPEYKHKTSETDLIY